MGLRAPWAPGGGGKGSNTLSNRSQNADFPPELWRATKRPPKRNRRIRPDVCDTPRCVRYAQISVPPKGRWKPAVEQKGLRNGGLFVPPKGRRRPAVEQKASKMPFGARVGPEKETKNLRKRKSCRPVAKHIPRKCPFSARIAPRNDPGRFLTPRDGKMSSKRASRKR